MTEDSRNASMNIPAEVQALLKELRSRYPELADVADEHILDMLQQAQAGMASDIEDLDQMSG